MINREEALALMVNATHSDRLHIILRIYNSIGTCGECKYYDNNGHVNICGHDLGLCDIVLNKDAYCYHFKRKIK